MEVGRKIESLFLNIHDVIIPTGSGKQGRHIRILVEIDISKALLRVTTVRIDEGAQIFVTNVDGHAEKVCPKASLEEFKGSKTQLGVSMRAFNPKTSPKKKSLSDNTLRFGLKSKKIIANNTNDLKGDSQNQKKEAGNNEDLTSIGDVERQLNKTKVSRGIKITNAKEKGFENNGRLEEEKIGMIIYMDLDRDIRGKLTQIPTRK
ncbi:hypothetical protein ACH5RR_023832 [Cinchona calisaya]|uniref:Uncharacterized protein n=1 Tax=Cinchona calisaya TaxID=153742 RepID=A0ABD2ZF77_9GENT